ncbi:MAG: hypothetical protein AABY07_08205, partial [Nanoarchaeota archaeon]
MKKGQAAMEFLMTYGWALLVVLIAIAALAFFGVLNPSRFLPNSCNLAPGFGCVDFKADDSDNAVTIILQNGLGDTLNGVILSLTSAQGGCASATFTPGGIQVLDGSQTTFIGACAGLAIGAKLKGDLIISYTTSSGVS